MKPLFRSNYLGAVLTAMLFVAGVNGFIKAAEPPVTRLIVLLVNEAAHGPNFLSLQVPRPEWQYVGINFVIAAVFAIAGYGLAAWLYAGEK